MRWIPWLIAAFSAAFGGWLLHESAENRLIIRADRAFENWLISSNLLPKRPPVPVTLVEMEDPDTWTALEYSLFLKAIPEENPPVVVFESLPAEGNSAFDRAFRDLAIRQPRLILPVTLSTQGPPAANLWWLGGWQVKKPAAAVPSFTNIESGPPEVLRGTTAVGVANLPVQNSRDLRFPAYFALEKNYLPSLALRTAMMTWKIAPEQVEMRAGLLLAGQHLAVDDDGTFAVDQSVLPGIRRIPSSDLLLRLETSTETPETTRGISSEMLRGILILGDLSDAARVYPAPNGQKLTHAELLAAAVATICNGPVSSLPGKKTLLFLILVAALAPLAFLHFARRTQWLAFLLVLAFYFVLCLFLAGRFALVLPLLLPFAIFTLSFALNLFAQTLPRKNE